MRQRCRHTQPSGPLPAALPHLQGPAGGSPAARRGRQQRAPQLRAQPQQQLPAASPGGWAAIKAEAHQGFEELLRRAGLPVNAGFSRPSSFTAAGARPPHPAAQLGLAPPWARTPGAAGSWGAAPQLELRPEHATHPADVMAWQQLPPQQQGMYVPPPQLEAGPQQQAWQPSPEPYWAVPPQQPTGVAGSAAWAPPQYGCLPPGPAVYDSSLRRSFSDGTLTADTSASLQPGNFCALRTAASGAAAMLSQPLQQQQLGFAAPPRASQPEERHEPAAKLPSSFPMPMTNMPVADPAAVPKPLASGRTSRSSLAAGSAGSSTGGESRGGSAGVSAASSLGSCALEALAAAAEEGDVPRFESEANEAQLQHTAQQAATAVSAEPSREDADTVAEMVAAGSPLGAAGRRALPVPDGAPPSAASGAAQALHEQDASAAAAAALARFQQLQAQLQQLQAGLPGPAAGHAAAAAPSDAAASPVKPPFAAPAAAASPVVQIMQQAESFLAEAQALLQRLQVAARSPPPAGLSPEVAQQACSPAEPLQRASSAAGLSTRPSSGLASGMQPHAAGGGGFMAAADDVRAAAPAASQHWGQAPAWCETLSCDAGPPAYLQWGQLQQQESMPSALLPPSWQLEQPGMAGQQHECPSTSPWWQQQEAGSLHDQPPPTTIADAPAYRGRGTWEDKEQLSWARQAQAARLASKPAAGPAGGYAQRQQAAAAAAARPSSAQPPKQQQGSYVRAARQAKVRGHNWLLEGL